MKTMSKRIFPLLISAIMVIAMIPYTVFADSTASGTFTLAGDTAHGSGEHYAYSVWIDNADFTVAEGTTVQELFEDILSQNGYTYNIINSAYGAYLDSVTSPGGCTLASGTNGSGSGWMFSVNGVFPAYSADTCTIAEGDEILFFYIDDYFTDTRFDSNYNVVSSTDVSLPDYTAEWGNYRGTDSTDTVSSKTPRNEEEALKKWSYSLRAPDDWFINVSDPLIVNDNIYIAAGNELLIISKDGELLNKTTLADSIDYTSRPIYVDGRIIVPLHAGKLQALAADTLLTLWVTPEIVTYDESSNPQDHQSLSTLTYSDGYVYTGTAYADWSTSYRGVFECIEVATGNVVWQYDHLNAGFYWSGCVAVNGAVVFAGDDGMLLSLNAKTGDVLDSLSLGAPVRSTAVLSESQVFVVSNDGTLHKINVLSDGTFGDESSVNFASSSTCAPTIYDGKAIVGGSLGEAGNWAGVICVIDINEMDAIKSVSAPADVKSCPLVSTGFGDDVYVYFTSNTTPGGIYSFNINDSSDTPTAIFTPTDDEANYCLSSIIADSDGTLYYTNDSGRLFAIKAVITEDEEETVEKETAKTPAENTPSAASQTISQSPATADNDIYYCALILTVSLAGFTVLILVKKAKEK